MIVVGVDPSLTRTGIYANDKAGVILSRPVEDASRDHIALTIRRCERVMDDITAWLLDNRVADLGPCHFIVEGPSFGADRKTGSHLLEMGIWYGCFARCFGVGAAKITIINPATLKKFITGKGNAPKESVPLIVYKRYGVEFDADPGFDKVHAFALERIGHAINDGTFDFKQPQRRGARRKTQSAANTARRTRKVQV